MARYRAMGRDSESLLDLAAFLPSWELAMRAERKSAKTIVSYTTGVRSYLHWCADAVPTVTKPAVQAWVAALLEAGRAPNTATAHLKGLRQFCRWLVVEGELPADPLAGMRSPKVDTKVVTALSTEELTRLIKVCAGRDLLCRRDEAIVRLMIETGCRAAELLGLQMPDVDLKRGLVTITRGKGGKGRVVPIGAATGVALDRYLRGRRTAGHPDSGNLWVGRSGSFGYYGLAYMLKARAAQAGITGMHAHLLRHSFATRWKAARGSDDGLMAVAGWSSRSMIDRYTGAAAAARAADEARLLGLGDL